MMLQVALESSIMLLENIYRTGFTHDDHHNDHHIFKVLATGVNELKLFTDVMYYCS
jgi:hypothetical protein